MRAPEAEATDPTACSYAVGEVVEYHSATQGMWIPARVVKAGPGGLYTLDCKPDVPPDKIRKKQRTFEGAEHQVGDLVEYNSSSQQRWILAKVIAVNAKGSYDLDCKVDVPPHRVRKVASTRGASRSASRELGAGAGPARGSDSRRSQAEFDAPVQLLKVHKNGDGWRYEVCPEAAALLEGHGSRRIAVASVCGPARTGKSYLLNLLLERVQRGLPLFQVGATTNTCTEGIWLWGSVGGAEDDEDGRLPLVAFLDCEGFGSTEGDKTRDAQLVALCSLLSSVLVLNTRGSLSEGLFRSLALACRFVEHVEERGSEPSRPALLWVLRDFALELQDTAGRPLTADEYLEQALRQIPQGDEERSQSAREVRQSLQRFFSHRSCATLVQPAVEEAHLQDLPKLPYATLRPEFRTAVEALRAQLLATCRAGPKAAAGEPLGCRSFVALLKQLVEALNSNRTLSVKAAWESLQHVTCGSLAEELAAKGSQALRQLASGKRLPNNGGVELPMSDEALREVLRDHRHALKSQWDDRAVGDEAVRREYWQELKEGLAREEAYVRQQNARLADQLLMDSLRRWQEWLDSDGADATSGERVSHELGRLMERMPAAPLSRASRGALEAAALRVTAARTAIAAAAEHAAEARKRAEAFGKEASRQEGAARAELDSRSAELRETQDRLRTLQRQGDTQQSDLQTKMSELRNAKEQLQAALEAIKESRHREGEFGAQCRAAGDREVSLRAELDEVREAATKAEVARIAAEKAARLAVDTATQGRQQVHQELLAALANVERSAEHLANERLTHREMGERTRQEHAQMVEDAHRQVHRERTELRAGHERAAVEHARRAREAQQRVEEERRQHAETLEAEQQRLLDRERAAGLLEGKVATLSAEASMLREHIAELQAQLRAAECRAGQQRLEGTRLSSDLTQAKAEADAVRRDAEERVRTWESESAKRSEEERLRKAVGASGCAAFRGRRTRRVPEIPSS